MKNNCQDYTGCILAVKLAILTRTHETHYQTSRKAAKTPRIKPLLCAFAPLREVF
jgi:hypothetical protein